MFRSACWLIVLGVGVASAAWAQDRDHPCEPVTVMVPVTKGLEDQAKRDALAEALKPFAPKGEFKVVEAGFTFALKQSMELEWGALKTAIEGTGDDKPFTLGDPMLAGKVRLTLDTAVTVPENRVKLSGLGVKIKSLGGITGLRMTPEGAVEMVVAEPGVAVSAVSQVIAKAVKLAEDAQPISEITWYGPRESAGRGGSGRKQPGK